MQYSGLRLEKIRFDAEDSVMTASTECTLMVAYNDNDHSGLCDEAEHPDHPNYGNYMEYYINDEDPND